MTDSAASDVTPVSLTRRATQGFAGRCRCTRGL